MSMNRRAVPTAVASAMAVALIAAPGVSARSSTDRGAHAAATRSDRLTMAPRAKVAVAERLGYMLGGFTSQQWPVVIQMGGKGERIRLAAAGVMLTCSQGDGGPYEDAWTGVPIGNGGKVDVTQQIAPVAGLGESLTGGSHSLTGRFNRARTVFTGVWRVQMTFQSASGMTDQCDSGDVGLTATL